VGDADLLEFRVIIASRRVIFASRSSGDADDIRRGRALEVVVVDERPAPRRLDEKAWGAVIGLGHSRFHGMTVAVPAAFQKIAPRAALPS
jgi:hypothetical protein